MVYVPHACEKCATTIAHTGREVKIDFHGIGTSCNEVSYQ